MTRHHTRGPRLQDRDEEILDHVKLHRITTPEILHRLFFPNEERNAVTKVTSRLCDHNYLKRYTLYSSYHYFTFDHAGVKARGLSRAKLGELGPSALYREYGHLLFFCSTQHIRRRFTITDIMTTFPNYIARGINSSHYCAEEVGDTVRFGYVWVEEGGDINHVRKKVVDEIIGDRRQVTALRQLIDAGAFFVAVVTINEHRRAAIADALNSIPLTSPAKPVWFRVEAFPELSPLLPKR